MKFAKSFHRSFRRKFPGVKITDLPNDSEIRRKILGYVNRKHAMGTYPTMEQVRKGCFSPTPGRTLDHLRHVVIDLGLKIDQNDRVIQNNILQSDAFSDNLSHRI